MNSDLRASSLNVPALESSLSSLGLPQGSLASSVAPGSQPPSVSRSTALPSTTTNAILAAGLPATSSTDLLSSGQNDPGTESLEAYFTAALLKPEKRVKQIVSVVQGYSKSRGFSDGFYNRLSRWSLIFPSNLEVDLPETPFETKVAHRLHRLRQARQNIKNKDWGDTRLWLILLAHEVEYISKWEYIDLFTSRGIDPMAAATKMATKYLDTAGGDYKRARNIVQVMKEGGPASLLENGGLAQSV